MNEITLEHSTDKLLIVKTNNDLRIMITKEGCPQIHSFVAFGENFKKLMNYLNSNEKLVAILGGGDWADASVDHLVVPKSVNLEEEHKKYRDWYNNEYCGSKIGKVIKYMSFPDWLIKLGARKTTDEDIEIFDET